MDAGTAPRRGAVICAADGAGTAPTARGGTRTDYHPRLAAGRRAGGWQLSAHRRRTAAAWWTGTNATAATAPGFKGPRNAAFFTVLYETGSRVNALRMLAGDAVLVLPNGRVRLILHAKGQPRPREVELSDQAADLLLQAIEAFNHQATTAGRCERIVIGELGPVWRSSWRGRWAYRGVAQTFEQACLTAGTHAYTLHALRRAFATDAASYLPRHVVARAGGWQGLDRLDNHYIRPREETIFQKLGGPRIDDAQGAEHHAAAAAI